MITIFTDIDGVLNPHWKKQWCKKSIKLYNEICNKYNLQCVISSTWRLNHTIEQLQKIFTEQGITVKIVGYTPCHDCGDRGAEILEYIETNNIEKYLVIDDKIRDIVEYINEDFVVKTISYIGINNETIEEIEQKLNKIINK